MRGRERGCARKGLVGRIYLLPLIRHFAIIINFEKIKSRKILHSKIRFFFSIEKVKVFTHHKAHKSL